MKKPTTFKSVLVVLLFIQSFIAFAQKDFSVRYDTSLKGDMLLIGNNILNRDENKNGERPNNAFDAINKNNNNLNMQYIDVDSDSGTFSSSTADLSIPTASKECYKIVYAGLYWTGIYSKTSVDNGTTIRANLGNVKFKLPKETNYRPIVGEKIYDYYPGTANGDQMIYAYYYNVTSLLQGLTDPIGTYTVADIISARGTINGGYAAGWSLFVVYEDPKATAKYITSFDGFRFIQATSADVTYKVSGFKTIPTGDVNAKLAFAAIEGDRDTPGDRYSINGTDIFTNERDVNNFFNSTINNIDGPFTDRNPKSVNTLGYDSGIIKLNNANNSVIKNGDTEATLKLRTSGDGYGLFFNAFNVEIIEPKIVLTKIVQDAQGNNIGGQNVTLGQQLNYIIGFRNSGNDDATSFTIRDQLPINVIFNYPTDILPLPNGVKIKSWDPATRSIVFEVDNSLVKKGGLTETTIQFKVQVIPDCTMLDEACSNSIDNSAYATYKGTQNTSFVISDDPSVNTNTGCLLIPKATNFLVNVAGCEYKRTEILCTESVDLVAADGYSTYTWYSDAAMKNKIGSGQTFNVKNPGTYYVYNLAPAPCRSISESFTVTRFGNTIDNPVLTYADQIVICPNDGKKLPNIFLCGSDAFKLIKTGISDSNNIVWERLDTSSCTAPTSENCANEGTSCKWLPAGTGPDYKASVAGQYRLTINYAGNCFSRFYFNVFTNSLTATPKVVDILCGKAGSITIEDVPAGYEYAIRTDPSGAYGTWQNSNVFPITAANSYSVNIRQKGVTTNPCIFNVPNILVRKLDLEVVAEITQPVCFGEKGTIKVGAKNLDQYYYYLYNNSNTLLQTVGPTSVNNVTFDLTPGGTYYVRVTSSALTGSPTPPAPSCNIKTSNYSINNVSALTVATASLAEPATACSPGKILLSGSGGTAPYTYFVNNSPTYINTNPFEYTTGGTYNILLVDSKGCKATTSITVADPAKPTYKVNSTSSDCYDGTSSIRVENVVPNGYTMYYSINDGASYSTNPIFSNLQPGNYKVKVKYTITYAIKNYPYTATKECSDPFESVVLTGPSSALTASAGVAALAGCSLPDANGVKQGGKLRINNVEGGTAPYEFNFGDGKGWVSVNEADVKPGTYILKVRDSKGCEFTIPYDIILDPKPADPTINEPVLVFGCDGTATTTVTVTNPQNANYTYEYYIDGVANTPITNNVFTNVKSGDHKILVKYKVTKVPTYSNLLREDFGRGPDTKIAGIHPAYCWEPQDYVEDCGIGGYMPILLNDGEYVVTKALLPEHKNGFNWNLPKDNTAVINNTPQITDGRFLAVNVGGVVPIGGILYRKTINDIIPNQDIQVSLYMLNLLASYNNLPSPRLTIQLQKNGVVVPGASKDTQDIPRDEKWHSSTDLGNGTILTLNPGNNTSLDFVILSYSQVISGNDLAVDDIWVRQIPEICGAEKEFKVIVDSGKAFEPQEPIIDDVSCNGKTPPDGKITLNVKNFTGSFQYSINNGGSWSTSTVSPVTISGLAVGTYKIIVKSDTKGTCSTSFTKDIKSPTALTLAASVVTQPTCTTGASIKATAGGGVPNYQYELRLTNGTVVVPFQNSDTFNLAVGQIGDFVVFIKDAGPCSSGASNTVKVTAAVPPTASIDVNASDLCYDLGNKATLVVSVSNGKSPFSYAIDGQAGQASNSFVVDPGLHSIIVTDANGCTATVSGIPTIAKELKASADVTKKLDCTSSPNAQITITPQDGTPNYTYEVSVNGGGYVSIASNVYPTSVSGSFVFRVTDSKGCKFVTSAVKVDAKVDPTASIASQNDPKCNNGTDGQFTVLADGGNGAPYTYSFNGGTFGTSATYSGLNAYVGAVNTKKYTYQVKDSKGCVSPVYDVILTNPAKVVADAKFTPNTTCSTTTLITSSGQGGTGVYTYNFGAGNTSYNGTNTLSVTNKNVAQTITYSVKDSNGCIDTKTIVVPAYNPPTGLTVSTPVAITCNTTTTSVTVAAVAGVAPFTYVITAGPVVNTTGASSGTFTGLTAGNYDFKVTDANGCTAVGSTTIGAAPTISVAGGKTNEQCVGAKDGTATFNITGASSTGNFTYTFSPVAGTLVQNGDEIKVTGLAAGTYTLVVKDKSTGCTSNTAQVTISAATAITFNVNGTKINCSTTVSTLTISSLLGGAPGYTYAYAKSPSTVPSTAYGTTLDVDTASLTTSIDVYVKDTNGCFTKKTVVIGAEAVPTINPIATQCYTGTPISVTITGTYTGTPTYSKDGITYGTSPTFSLTPGTYKLSLKDGFGCPASITYVVADQLTITPTIVADATCTPNTTISLSSAGGTGTKTYEVSFNGGGYSASTNPYVASATGTYKFRVTDSATPSCSAVTADIPVTLKATTLTISTSKVDVKCNGDATGSILVNATSGKAPFTYSITKSTAPFTNYTVNNPSGLTAGTYNIVVTDALGCTSATSTSVTINENSAVTAVVTPGKLSCNTANTPTSTTISVVAGGGKAGYTYSYNNGSTYIADNSITVSNTGASQSFTIIVKDANGCLSIPETVVIAPLNSPTDLDFGTPAAITCLATTTNVQLTATNGVAPLKYSIVSGPTVNTSGATTGLFSGLLPGDYVFRVTDNNGCYYSESYKINKVTPIEIAGQAYANVQCFNGNSGIAKYTITNFSATGNYSITVTSTPASLPFTQTVSGDVITLSNLGKGVYNVKVTDLGTGCSADKDVTITEPAAALSAIAKVVNANCKVATAEVTITASNGTPSYKYSFVQDGAGIGTLTPSPVANLNPATNLNWDVYVVDANGCQIKLDVAIAADATPSVTASAAGQCLGNGTYTVTATPGTGLVAPLTYSLNGGAYQSGNTFDVTASGSYIVTIKDGNGCTAPSNAVTVYDKITISSKLDKNITCETGNVDAKITLTATGGRTAYTYTSNPATGTFVGNVFTTSTPGSYTFTVTDANNCSATTTDAIVITTPVKPSITSVTQTQTIGCSGQSTASINVVYDTTQGVSPFVINVKQYLEAAHTTLIKDFGTQTSGLPAGYYVVTLTDSKKCFDTFNIRITEPDPIAISFTPTSLKCNGSGITQGTITINSVTGGTPNYTYYVTGINNYNKSLPNQTGGSAVFEIVDFGLYQIRVEDQNGCSAVIQDVLIAAPPTELGIDVNIVASCAGGSATVKILSAFTGVGPFHFNIYNGGSQTWNILTPAVNIANGWLDENPAGSKSTVFNGLTPGKTYTFIVYDEDTKCYYFQTSGGPVPTNSTLQIDNFVPQNITCTGANNGNVSFSIKSSYATSVDISYDIINAFTNISTGNTGTRTIAPGATVVIDPAATTTPLPVGTYYVLVSETNGSNMGCGVSSINFNVKESPKLFFVDAKVSKNANCNPKSGVISVFAKDGTAFVPPLPATGTYYKYMLLLASDPAPTATDAGWGTDNTFFEDAGSYVAYGLDAYGCIKSFPITLDKDADPVLNPPASICYAGNPFTITINGTVDPAIVGGATYSVNGSEFKTDPSFTFNAAGTYKLVIKDGNGCTDDFDYVVYPQLKLDTKVTKELDCSTSPNAVITLTAQGGNTLPTANYIYEYSTTGVAGPWTTMTTNQLTTGATNVTYTFRLTDGNNATTCQVTSDIKLDPIPLPTITPSSTNVACKSGTDGTISVSVTGGVGPFQYQLMKGTTIVVAYPGSSQFTGLVAGNDYQVIVKDSNLCEYTTPAIIITEPLLLDAKSAVTDYACDLATNVQQSATVIVTVDNTTGTGPYKYLFPGYTDYSDDNTFTVNGTVGGTIAYTVKDSNGCLFNGSQVVLPYQKLTAIDFALVTAPVCPTNVADVRVDITGGYTPMAKYEIIEPVAFAQNNGTSNLFTGLAPDTYLFKVTDAHNCSIQAYYTIDPVVPIEIVAEKTNEISCNVLNGTNNNGSAKFTVSDFSASGNYGVTITSSPAGLPYTNTAAGDVITLTGLVAGTYTVEVTDNTTHCIKSASVTFTEPTAITFAAVSTKVFCSRDISEITVSSENGGAGNYTYAVVKASDPVPTTFGSNPVLSVDTNLTDLSWDVYVKDSKGCISQLVNVPVIYNAAPNLIAPAQQCFVGADIVIDLANAAISTTYNGVKSFTVDGLSTVGTVATFKSAGTYRIVLTDDNGCTTFVDYVIQKQLLATATLTKDLYCAAPINATIDVEISNGVAGYTYETYFNGALVTGGPTTVTANKFTASVAAAGDYYFVITDSNTPACSVTTNTVTVNPTAIPTLSHVETSVSCFNGNDGTLTVEGIGGRLAYTYTLTGAFANTTGDSTGKYTGLRAGSYTVTATDSKNCTSVPVAITITQPVELTATHAIPVNTTCSVATVITVTGHDGTATGTGVGGYYYNFNNKGYDTNNTFTVNDNTAIQTVTYSVKDGNGCETAPVTVTINPLNKPKDLTFTPTAITCLTGNSSNVTVKATDGVGALTFTITEFNGAATVAYAPQTVADNTVSTTFNGLPFGDYKFSVKDSNGCTYDELMTIKDVTRILVTNPLLADMSCNATNDGKVTFEVTAFAGTYTYTITKDGAPFVAATTTSANLIPLTNLAFGTYVITATDDITTCPATYSAVVVQPSVVTVAEVSNVNANCKRGGIVEVIGGGGNPGYTYSFVSTATPGAFTVDAKRELTAGTWYVYAQDINGCISAPITVTVATDPLPAGFTASVTSYCADSNGNYEIVVTPGTGMSPFEYSIGGGFQSGTSFTVNVAKAYDVVVRDKFGCETTFPAAITILQPLDLKYDVIDLPTCADFDGKVSAQATGGSGNYSYTIDGVTTVTVAPIEFGGLKAGAHEIIVTDVTTTCTAKVNFTLSAATPVTGFDAIATPVTCNGGNNGKIVASIAAPSAGVNDNPIYMYSLNGGTPQASPVFEGLTAGDYTVAVISGRGCPDSKLVHVDEPALIMVPNPAVVQYGCITENVSNFATITISGVTGGSGTYTNYEFIKNGTQVYYGPKNVYTEMDYLGGSYTVNVYDNNQCIGTNAGTYVIFPYINLDKINIDVTDPITCPTNENIKVSVETTGGTPTTLNYSIAYSSGAAVPGNPTNTNGIFTNLPIGEYVVTVVNTATGCTIQKVHNVFNPNTFNIKAETVNGKICFGANDGSVDLTFIDNQLDPSDEAGIFDYVITGPVSSSGTSLSAGPHRISNLTAGQYTVVATLKGKPNCTVETVFAIEQPNAALVATSSKADITCITGNNDGEISATATGGWGTYEYQLVKGATTVVDYSAQNNFTGLDAGVYTINVRDYKGCSTFTTQTLIVPLPIIVTASANVTMLPCFGDKSAVITVDPPTGGQGSNYMYTLNYLSVDPVVNSGPVQSPIFSGLGAGRYSVTVTDGFTCQATSAEIVINEPTVVLADLVESRAQTCLTLTQLTLSAEGGTGPYTYSTDGTTVLGSFTSSISFDVPVGSHKYYVKDANGCTSFVSNTIEIIPLVPLAIKLDVSSAVIKCTGEATGVITADAVGGLGNYKYSLLNGAGTTTIVAAQDSGRFEGLVMGTYRVKVESGDCNITSEIITINEPAKPLTAQFFPTNVTCFGENNGKLNIVAEGGTGVIKYALSPDLNQFDTKFAFDKLAPGDYQVIVQDENGCFVLHDFTITQPTILKAKEVPNSMIPEVCFGDKDGAFSVEVTGGTPDYSVSLDVEKGPFTQGAAGQTIFDFTNLTGGKHIVYYKDSQGCTNLIEINMPLPVVLNPTAEVNYDCVNNAQSNMVTITVDKSNTDLTQIDYSLDGTGTYQPGNIFTNVAPGTHTVTVRHTNGCEVPTASFDIKPYDPLTIALSSGQQEMNVISVTAAGGAAPYEYSFNGEPFTSSNKYKIYKSGDYIVVVRDQNGCTATITVPAIYIDVCLDNYFTPNGDGVYDTWGPGCTNIYNNLEFSIFDRYGRVIAKYHYGQKWDGRYNGAELPSGDYWYVLKLNDEKDDREFVGHFTLYR